MTSPFTPNGPFADVNAISTENLDAILSETGGETRDTDRVNALTFTERYGDRVIWTPENGWYVYDETRWRPDTEQYRHELIGQMASHLLQLSLYDEDNRQILRARVRRLESHGGLLGALRYAEHMNAKSLVDMDTDPYLLNCKNGTLDLRTGKMVPRDSAHFITRYCPTVYDADAVDGVWEKVRHEGLGNNKAQMDFFQRYMGYSLTGDYTMKKFLAMHGPSDAGKSTIVEPFHILLGDVDEGGYVSSWDADVLQADSTINRGEKLNKIRAARLVLVGELEKGKRLADGFVKKFTGGNAMDAKALYKGSYTYRPRAKLILDTNYVPKSADPAVHNRLILMPMTHVPPIKDSRIKAHLEESENAHRALLAWAVRGAMRWWDTKSLGETPWMEAAMSKYVRSSDVLINFVDDCFDHEENAHDCVPATFVHPMYVAWCFEEGSKPMQRRTFMDAMEERGHTKFRIAGGGATVMTGIKLKNVNQYSEHVKAAVLSNLMGKTQG